MSLPVTIHVQITAPFRAKGLTALARAAALAAMRAEEFATPCELTVRITDDAELRALNAQFRHIDKATDVLSFNAQSAQELSERDPYLGDIVISMERCRAQAKKHSVEDELALLVAHGTLHLLGHDHMTPQDKKVMWRAQKRALQSM
jgi:probable rRNA maturation factor